MKFVNLDFRIDCDTTNGGGGGGSKVPVETDPTSVDILILVLSIVGAIVLVGVVLLVLLRMAAYVHDKREFSRFQKEQTLAVWDKVRPTENPHNSIIRICSHFYTDVQ